MTQKNNYDIENYDLDSANARLMEQRLRNAGVWPENPIQATKMLRRQLRILRAGDMADMVAFGSVVNNRDDEKVRLRYWSDRAARLCQDKESFDWPKSELSLEEIRERLEASGIDPQMIEDDLEKVMERAKVRRDRNKAREERRQKEYLKEQEHKQLLELKYRLLLSRVEQEHGLKLEFCCLSPFPNEIRINWRPEVQDGMITESYFSVYRRFSEEESSTVFPSVVNAILDVAPICQATVLALQRSGNHLLFSDNQLMVASGCRIHGYPHYSIFYPFEERQPEEIVTEGEDVDLAVKLYEQVKAAGLSLCAF